MMRNDISFHFIFKHFTFFFFLFLLCSTETADIYNTVSWTWIKKSTKYRVKKEIQQKYIYKHFKNDGIWTEWILVFSHTYCTNWKVSELLYFYLYFCIVFETGFWEFWTLPHVFAVKMHKTSYFYSFLNTNNV